MPEEMAKRPMENGDRVRERMAGELFERQQIIDCMKARLDNLLRAVDQMRLAQREYFKTGDRSILRQAKQAEKRVDDIVGDLKQQQRTLF